MSSAVWKYRLGPFALWSEMALPELESQGAADVFESDGAGSDDVWIRLGSVPERIEDVVANESQWWASRTEYLQRIPGVANFLVRNGREILVEPADGAADEDVRAYLLSPIFSALCHQAGMYALHASAVRVGGGVAAFVGNTRAGKSTLAAGLAKRGYSVIADDICLLDTRTEGAEKNAETGPALVTPVVPALKLWRSALEHLGTSYEALPRVIRNDEKFRLKLSMTDAQPVRLPLRQIFFLEWSEDDDPDAQPAITSVEGVAAITRLMEFTHCGYLMKATGRQTGNFLLCGRVLSEARAYCLRRPRNFALLEQTLDRLEALFGKNSE